MLPRKCVEAIALALAGYVAMTAMAIFVPTQSLANPNPEGQKGTCFIEIQGKKYQDGACLIYRQPAGGFSTSPTPPDRTFVSVDDPVNDSAEGFWNGAEGASHAHESLGNLTRHGDCWSNSSAKICASSSDTSCRQSLRSAGIPEEWESKKALLAFATGHDEPFIPLLCTWSKHGVKFRYSSGIPLLSDPSLEFAKEGVGRVKLSLSATEQNGFLFLVPTSYSGPEGSITVSTTLDLQQIYVLLMSLGS